MDSLTQIASVPLIVAVVYALMSLYKYALKCVNNKTPEGAERVERLMRIIPIFAVISGGILGAVCYYKIPDIIVVDNVLVALLTGMASGLAATGANQISKQAHKSDEDVAAKKQNEIETLTSAIKRLEEQVSKHDDEIA